MSDILKPGLDARLRLMREMASAARAITLPLFVDPPMARNKAETGYDPVTQADIDAEKRLRELISDAFPQDGITGEEFEDVHGHNEWLWTLDPIDGTRGFMAGIPVWSTLIAVSHQDRPVLGLIDIPAQDKKFWGRIMGQDHNRAWLEQAGRETMLTCRKAASLSESVLGCTEPFGMFTSGELNAYAALRRNIRFSRLGLDAYGYGMVAQGRMDLIIEAGMKPCDVRALIPVIEGAGGRLTDWQGGSAVNGGRVVAVGNADLLPEIYGHLAAADRA